MNKRGFLRIVEASIGVLVVLGVLLVLSSQKTAAGGEDLSELLPPLLDEVAKSEWRDNILTGEPDVVAENIKEQFLSDRIKNPRLDFDVKICPLDEICALDEYPDNSEGELFVGERVVSTTVRQENFEPKKVRVFLWRKKG